MNVCVEIRQYDICLIFYPPPDMPALTKNYALFVKMRTALLLLGLVCLILAAPIRSLPIAPHIPTQSVTPGSTYTVPDWLGAYYSTTGSTSTWTLPPTYKNGGNVSLGEFLIVRNLGSAGIVLETTSPETIEGGASYNVAAGTTAIVLSDYTNWRVVSVTSGVLAPLTSVAGTANQITSTCAAGVCTESLPIAVLAPGSLRTTTYLAVGSPSVPTNVATGAITTTSAAPTSQAFGAVTASAASGLLTFTVTTAAVTCANAVVTNTNVVAGSRVFVNVQGYTGTPVTNGLPVVARLDTSGSSVGSFTLQLCNTHASNALTGTLYVAFWVLN